MINQKESKPKNAYLGVYHPFLPLNQLAVCVGPAGIRRNDTKPMHMVKRPCKMSIEVKCSRAMRSSHLNQEQPSPALVAENAAHVKDAVRENGAQDIGKRHSHPEEAQPDGHFGVLVEVRQVQNDLFQEVNWGICAERQSSH